MPVRLAHEEWSSMASLKSGLVATVAALLFAAAACADECELKAAEAAGKIGGRVLPRWKIGIEIEHPSVRTLAIMCEEHKAVAN